jgi:hypothetical protein
VRVRRTTIFLFIIITILVYFFLEKTTTTQHKTIITPSPTIITDSVLPAATLSAEISDKTSLCHINGVLPDQSCTPGVIDPKVTQENISITICAKGYTKTVRPPTSYTNKLKLQQILDYGYFDKNPKNYEEDHLISLELGGDPTDPKNLWPEPGAIPNPKDKIENLCNKKVCDGEITLAEAQKQIANNWTVACQ